VRHSSYVSCVMAFFPAGSGGGVQRDTREYGAAALRSCASAVGTDTIISAIRRTAARAGETHSLAGRVAGARKTGEVRIKTGIGEITKLVGWSCASPCPNLQHRREDLDDDKD
jgi:hypothetical protein